MTNNFVGGGVLSN